MTGYTVSQAAALLGGTLHGDGSAEITRIVRDNREVTPGALFAALPGEKNDGHKFIHAALEAGASCALARFVPEGETGSVIVVPDVQEALEKLAADYRRQLKIPVLGITGSVGKTTAKEMVASVLGQRWKVLKTPGNFNNQLGVPMTLSQIGPEHEFAVVELGVSHFGDMAPLAKMAKPDAMLITIIGRCHLEFLIDRSGVFKEKTSVLDEMSADAPVFVNGDDDLLRTMTCRQRKITFGLSEGCDVRAVEIEHLPDGATACVIVSGERRIPVRITAYGAPMLYAALEGAAVGMEYGLTDEEIIAGIAAYAPAGDRARLIEAAGGVTIVSDCYNANPDSTAAALQSLHRANAKRRVAILGDMGELGEQENALHFETGETAAREGVDLLITCGRLSKHTAAGARAAGLEAVHAFDTLEEVCAALPDLIHYGDWVLVKASHSMQFEKLTEALELLRP